METNDQLSWTTVAARGLTNKIVRPSIQNKQVTGGVKLMSNVIFQHDDLEIQILARKAAAIVRQALTPGSVLFSFPAQLFKVRTDAYELIEKECGKVSGVRPISMYGGKSSGDLLVEVKFVVPESTTKAISVGVKVGELCFKASPSNDSLSNSNLVHVKLSLLRIPDEETFVANLKRSLRYYGEVYQIKKFTYNGYFEGEISVLLDVSAGYVNDTGAVLANQPLTNNLYLEEWDCFASAVFKGASPVCHWCKIAGHIRKNCPELAKRVCFSCNGRGHTAKFCKAKPQSEGDQLDRYLDDSNNIAGNGVESDDESVVDVEILEEAPTLFVGSITGSAASKHAPIDIRSTMDIDATDSDSGGVAPEAGEGDFGDGDDAGDGADFGVGVDAGGDTGVGAGVGAGGLGSMGGVPSGRVLGDFIHKTTTMSASGNGKGLSGVKKNNLGKLIVKPTPNMIKFKKNNNNKSLKFADKAQ